ncbi:MAG: hypothetical protein AAEJ53_15285 [Myxococcota bacterium]
MKRRPRTLAPLLGALGAVLSLAANTGRADDCTPVADPDPRACAGTHSLSISKRYLLAVHAATPGSSFSEHETYLLESDDGHDWNVVPGWEAYVGSVPEVTERDGLLYLFNPGKQRVYDLAGGSVSGASVRIADAAGDPVSYVDPSAIVDDQNRIVLFFLNSTGVPPGTDPASGTDPKDFDSATETPDSNALVFSLEAGPRVEALSSDPDIFFDGSQYVLYISFGANTRAYRADTLHGSYEAFPGLGSEALLTGAGGVPAGHYDAEKAEYWTYVHTNVGGANVVRRSVHPGFDAALPAASFHTVVAAADLGLDAATSVESPSLFDRGARVSTPLPGLGATGFLLLATLMGAAGLAHSRRPGPGAAGNPEARRLP